MCTGMHEEALQAMLESNLVRELLGSQHHDKWALATRRDSKTRASMTRLVSIESLIS